jgi:hypothetical protein
MKQRFPLLELLQDVEKTRLGHQLRLHVDLAMTGASQATVRQTRRRRESAAAPGRK